MNRGSGIKLLLIVILIAAAVYFSLDPIKNRTNLGLDLQGGAHVVLQAIPNEGEEITDSDMVKLTAVMRNRVDEFGVTEPIIQPAGNDRLIIELAGVDNPDKAIEILGRTAQLEFRDPAGQVVVTGADLKDAQARIDSVSGQAEISLEFTSEGAKKFGSATARLVDQPISIVLDGTVIQSPNVDEPIMNGQARITGGFTFEQAAENAALLRGGALPVNVEIMEKRTVGPTLGKDSLDKSFTAGMYGILVVLIFMIAYYRLPGVLANVSLIFYILLVLWIHNLLHVTFTLPGIAGFLLSIGMAVDANVIIFERIKEELNTKKTLRAAIDSGFKRAFVAIFDSNVTTLIAAGVLFYFGTGSIKGFAVTLSIGIISSMFTAITLTRLLIKWTSDINLFKNKKLYGI
ncbi:MAG: protein translocase subunit SecD [Desulfitobacteriaceae bacterium]|nr:protein translocase subunit SecD [Desulfitobacteriaceae bacterium]